MYYGCKKEVEDKRDYKSYICSGKSAEFPEKYTIEMPDVKDQGIVNSCVAHSLSTFMEETYKQNKIKFSTGFLYGYRPEEYNQDEGMYPRDCIKTLLKIGDVPNEKFNYNREMPEIKSLVEKNFQELREIANLYKIDSYSRIYTEQEIKKCIFNDIAVPISIPVYNDLEYDNCFIIKQPSGKLLGYHMVIVYGYNDKGWLIQNSWGKNWADKGRAILPFDYEIDTAWAIATETNNVITYTTIWQKLYIILNKFFAKIKRLFK